MSISKPNLPLALLAIATVAFAQDKAFTGARIIDGTGKVAIENATLLVRNGRIEGVGRSVRIPPDAQRIDSAVAGAQNLL